MHKVRTQRSGELFVNNHTKNMVVIFTIIIKTYKVKKSFNKFMEISK